MFGVGLTAWNYFVGGRHPQQIKREKQIRFLPSPWTDPVPDASCVVLEGPPPSNAAPSQGVVEFPVVGFGAASVELDLFAAEYEAAEFMQAFEAPADLGMEAPVQAACSLASVSAPSPGPGPVPSSERGALRSVQQALAQEEDEAPLCPPPSFRSKVDRLVCAAGGCARGEGRGNRDSSESD